VNPPPLGPDDEDELEGSLQQGLRRPPLPPDALARIRANVFAEFRQQTVAAHRSRRNRWLAGVAAAVGVICVGAFLASSYWARNTVVAELERTSGGGVVWTPHGSAEERLLSGAKLHPFQQWTSRGAALARLQAGGTLRMAEGTVMQALDPHTLALTSGRAYFDFPPGAGSFVLHTSIGTIEHVGTQFEVVQSENAVRVRVREGSVRLRGEERVISIGSGVEVRVDREGRVERGTYPAYGADWEWVEAVAPSYDIENRQLAEFLAWVARETGHQITFVDAHAREVANRTTLHGSIEGLRPMEALDQVLNTTTLRFEILGGEIRIASRS
jgi:ferric-dicitrate binding protein FerR (iron transport regulator)